MENVIELSDIQVRLVYRALSISFSQCFGSGQFQTGSGSGSPFSKKPDPDPGSRIRIPDLDLSKFVNQFRWNVRLSCADS